MWQVRDRKKKGNWGNQEQKTAKDNKSIRRDISITPREYKVYKGASGLSSLTESSLPALQAARWRWPYQGRLAAHFQKLMEWEGLFLCLGRWNSKAQGRRQGQADRPAFASAADDQGWQFQGAGCCRLKGGLGTGGQGALWDSSQGKAAVLSYSFCRIFLRTLGTRHRLVH